MAKLFEITIQYYAVADNADEAMRIPFETDAVDMQVAETKTVDASWWDSIPFGETGSKTCGDYVKEARS